MPHLWHSIEDFILITLLSIHPAYNLHLLTIYNGDSLNLFIFKWFSTVADCNTPLAHCSQKDKNDLSVGKIMALSDCSRAGHETCFGDQAIGC